MGKTRNELSRFECFLESKHAHGIITFLAIFSAFVMGVETYKSTPHALMHILERTHHGITLFFVFEMLLKIYVLGPKKFFADGWHVFDFSVVAISLLSMSTPMEAFSALRVLRLFCLLDFIPKMHGIAKALHHSIPGILGTLCIGLIIFYVSALLAHGFFSEKCPEFFGDLGSSLFMLLKVATFDGWANEVLAPLAKAYPHAWIFIILFMVIGGLIMLNLFIGVVVDAIAQAYEKVSSQEEASTPSLKKLTAEVELLRQTIERMNAKK